VISQKTLLPGNGMSSGRGSSPWETAPPWAGAMYEQLHILQSMIGAISRQIRTDDMATKETLDRLKADVQKNTDAAAAAKDALTGFVTTVADLTKALQDAISGGDEAEIKAAADALEANNETLTNAIPAISEAIPANT